ncbi:hypothetical protein GN156_39430, partial [bacterium LRH843]|nr:hypothetical protein [bacterium LRH843]
HQSFMGPVAKGLGIAGHAYQGAKGLTQLGKSAQRGKRMRDVKKGAGGGIVTPRGGAWYSRIANRNAWKAALQGLKV